MPWTQKLAWCLTILFGALRFTLVGPDVDVAPLAVDIYKAMAHCYVGLLFGLAGRWRFWETRYGQLGLGLTLLEIVAFTWSRLA